MSTKAEILHEVHREMVLAERKHGAQLDVPMGMGEPGYKLAAEEAQKSCDLAFKHGYGTWMHIALEEAFETFAEEDLEKIRAEALQAAAMFAQIARACDHQAEKIMAEQVAADPNI